MPSILYNLMVAIIVCCSLAAATILIAYKYFISFQPSRSLYPILGIDVSHHQGDIDWPLVATDDVKFAYIKATEGGDWKDRKFRENWQQARRAGITVGAYHFFTFCRPAKDQAQNIIETVPNIANTLPIAIDLEFGGNCKKPPSNSEITVQIQLLINILTEHYKKPPILYVTPEFYEAFSSEKFFTTQQLWVRSILFEPKYTNNKWTIWQFHNRGTRKGITGPVDLNVLRNKNLSDLITIH